MRTEQIYYVLEAVKTGSFTQAAQNLYLKPPGLRSGITSLEEELGYKIFDRHANGVTLTQKGEKILPKLHEILQIYEVLKLAPADNLDTIQEFRVSLMPNQYDELTITESMKFFHHINPLLKIKFLNSLYPLEQIKMLLNHQIDITQLTTSRAQLQTDPYLFAQLDHTWTLEIIGQESITPIVAAHHPLAQAEKVYTLEDFFPYTLVLNSLGSKPLLSVLNPQKTTLKLDMVYLSSSRKELADYLNYNAIYFCPSSLLQLEPYSKLVPLQLEPTIIFDNCLAYRLRDDNPLIPIYANFLRDLMTRPVVSTFK